MFWALLAGIGACTNAAYFLANKKFLEKLDPNCLACAGFFFSSLFLLGISLVHGIPAIGPLFLSAALATTALNILGTTLTFRALASTDVSLSVPMLSFTPLFLVLTAALILGEMPSAAGIAGIITIVAGSYVLNTSGAHTRITDPFRNMVSHPGVFSMLIVAFLYAVAINFDKMVVQNSDPYFGSAVVLMMLAVSFLILAGLSRSGILPVQRPALHPAGPGPAPSTGTFPGKYLLVAGLFSGFLTTLEAITINTAYLLQIVPYVIAIKRMSIILIVVYGALVFREKEIVRRFAGAGLMVLGAVLILAFP